MRAQLKDVTAVDSDAHAADARETEARTPSGTDPAEGQPAAQRGRPSGRDTPANKAPRPGRLPAEARQARIVAAFERDGFLSIAGLAGELGVSGMTIRRDVIELERLGLVRRTHGGAIPTGTGRAAFDTEEPVFDQRMRRAEAAKRAMAQAGARLVGPGMSVGLDVGTSVLALSEALSGQEGLRVVTNNLRVGMSFADSKVNVYMLGGQVRYPEGALIGQRAIDGLADTFLDLVFLGVSGIDGNGLYDYSPEDTAVKRAFMATAGAVVVLCDQAKFCRRALSRIAPLDAIDVLVTDAEPPGDLAAALSAAAVETIVAG
jgi:DeoR family glycerol-3-phosphate regulon repressor